MVPPIHESSTRLVAYIRSLPDFEIYTAIDGNYGHLGATLADAVLQANNNYERNVRRRIGEIREQHPTAMNLSGLRELLRSMTTQEFLRWRGTRKSRTFNDLTALLEAEGVNTEADLGGWLKKDGSRAKLIAIRFIGDKTADYLKILVGLPVAAVDRHLLLFLGEAGLGGLDYASAQDVIHRAADLMALDRAYLDHSIWRYMSSRAVAPRQDDQVAERCFGGAKRVRRRVTKPCRLK